MRSKSNKTFCKNILQNFYKDNPLQFLFYLKKFSFEYFAISAAADSIIMSWYLEQNLKTKYIKKNWEMKNLQLYWKEDIYKINF